MAVDDHVRRVVRRVRRCVSESYGFRPLSAAGVVMGGRRLSRLLHRLHVGAPSRVGHCRGVVTGESTVLTSTGTGTSTVVRRTRIRAARLIDRRRVVRRTCTRTGRVMARTATRTRRVLSGTAVSTGAVHINTVRCASSLLTGTRDVVKRALSDCAAGCSKLVGSLRRYCSAIHSGHSRLRIPSSSKCCSRGKRKSLV